MGKGLKFFLSALAAVYAIAAVLWFLPLKTSYAVDGAEYAMEAEKITHLEPMGRAFDIPEDGIRQVKVTVDGRRYGMVDLRLGEFYRVFHGDVTIGDVKLRDVYIVFRESFGFTKGDLAATPPQVTLHTWLYTMDGDCPYRFITSYDRRAAMLIDSARGTYTLWPASGYEEALKARAKLPW